MSIKSAQTERTLEEITRRLYSSGTRPTMGAILSLVSKHFSAYPAGLPLPLPEDIAVPRQQSSVEKFNQALAHMAQNVDVLYEVFLDQVDEVMELTSSLQSYLERLKTKRRRIEATIDDYLLALYATDGYFYSLSDSFSDLSLTDIALTSAFIDTTSGMVTIPPISSFTRRIPNNAIYPINTVVIVNGAPSQYRELASFSGAMEDGLTNTMWAIEVDSPVQATVSVDLIVGFPLGGVQMSRMDITPYGVTPVQCLVQTRVPNDATTGSNVFALFGGHASFGGDRMVFTDVLQSVGSVKFTLRKSEADYTTQDAGTMRYRYIFGAKDISFFEQVYDNEAKLVSAPLSFPADLQGDMVIDAVSLVVDNDVPSGTSVAYYVASDSGAPVTEVSDLDWRRIHPISESDASNTIVRFDGTQAISRLIRSQPVLPELQLIPMDDVASDLTQRNPSPVIIPGADVYRLCAFGEAVMLNSLKLEEGINTTRIAYMTTWGSDSVNTLSGWAYALKDPSTRIAFGRIDAGNGFFYGGDIGESAVTAYVETFIECIDDKPTFLAELSKSDVNSQRWDARVILNGREIGYLSPTTNRALLPWTLRQGLNHVVLLLSIPAGTSTGTISLMGDSNLFDYGVVKLDTWSYVDFFDLQHNMSGDPKVFSMTNGEIISRRKPTDNFRLTFAKETGRGPTAIRFRADMAREANSPYLSPTLRSYRLRFAYGEENV